jgi:L-iditol 2-dehydrogenase
VIVGHECAAVVEAVGPKVERVKPGDRVAVEPAISCGQCDQCLVGRPHTCRKVRFLGHPGELDGCLAEFFVLPQDNIFPIPASMTFTEAMLAEPLSIALHALALAGPQPGPSVAVLGTGPIGLSVILGAKAGGLHEIFATDRSDARKDAARRAGAAWAGNPDREDVACTILELQPKGMDTIFECSGDPAAIDQAVDLVKPGGRILQVGIPVVERVSYRVSRLRRKEVDVQHVRRQNRCLERALLLVEARHIEVAWLATHAFKLEEAQRAFTTAADRLDGVLKASIIF